MPDKKLSSTSLSITKNMKILIEIAQQNDRYLYPFGVYPGINKPKFRTGSSYTPQKKIFGERFINAGLCCGYHQHYTMPRGIFSENKVKYKINSKVKRTFLDSYNFMIAADPIFTTLLQSSPFHNNKYLAKDSRMLLYRGGKKLRYNDGLYAKQQFFGALQPYKHTLHDLLSSSKRRYNKWKKLIGEQGHTLSGNQLKYAWNPVKLNPQGTLEYRGSDMNYLSNIFSVATMLKFALRKIQQDFLLVVPSDIELNDSFKKEGNMLFIPPQTVVRKILQRESAHDGLKSDKIYSYTRSFMKFIKKNVYKEYRILLKPAEKMISEKKTMSDKIIEYARKHGHSVNLNQKFSQELSIHFSEKFEKDTQKTYERLMKLKY